MRIPKASLRQMRQNLTTRYSREMTSQSGFKAMLVSLSDVPGCYDVNEFFRGKSILDVGCGTGNDLIRFQRLGATAVGTDINISRKNLPITLGRAGALPFPPDHFDVVFAKFLADLLPLTELASFPVEAHRVLRPGGHLLYFGLIWDESYAIFTESAKRTGFQVRHVIENHPLFLYEKSVCLG